MLKTKVMAAVVASSLCFANVANALPNALFVPATATGAGVNGGAYALPICVISIMLAAADKGQRWHRELTTEEAATCGLLYWVNAGNRPRR